ncbi:catalase [Pseudomonas sp. ABAC21]|nr:catalase [Pseudomonas sp. ABAC21]
MIIRSQYNQRSLLARLWLRLGAWLGKTLLWLVGLGLLGWLAATGWYAWQHSGPVSPNEQIPPGEAAMTQGIIQTAVRIVDQHREGTRYLRDAHAKAHGCVKAEVSVPADLDPALRQGVFAEPGKTWQALMRLSNGNAYPQFDSIRDARGMAIKLLDVPGKQLMADQQTRTEQDFVMFSHPNFFVSDVAEYAQNIGAQADGKKIQAFFPSLDPRSWQVRHLFIALATLAPAPASPTQTTYFSVSPYKFGAANAKFRVAPDPQSCPQYTLPKQNEDLPNFLRSALNQQLSTDRVAACFVFRVRIPAQDFDTPALNLACDNQSFNPWFGVEAHRPIGGINRLRKAVYEAVSDYRHSRNTSP